MSWLFASGGQRIGASLSFLPVNIQDWFTLTFTIRFIHNWALVLLWPLCFLLSGATGDCPLLFPSSILDTLRPGELIFLCHVFLPFHTVLFSYGVLKAGILAWLAIPSPSGPRFVRALPCDLAILGGLHGVAHGFMELLKLLHHQEAVLCEGDFLDMNPLLQILQIIFCGICSHHLWILPFHFLNSIFQRLENLIFMKCYLLTYYT